MLVLQVNVLVRDPETRKHITELLASVQPPVLTKSFESFEQLSSQLASECSIKRQILVTDGCENSLALNQQGFFMAAIVLGSKTVETSTAMVSVTRLPNSEELVDAIQSTYRVADQYFKLQNNKDKITNLADRERRIIELAAEGTPNKAIASRLGISIKTVEKNRRNAYSKLNVSSAAEMASLVTFNRFCQFPTPSNNQMIG